LLRLSVWMTSAWLELWQNQSFIYAAMRFGEPTNVMARCRQALYRNVEL